MKDILVYCVATGILLFYSMAANAVELENASNQQLLQELRYRLNNGGTGGDAASLVSYCIDGDDIFISLENSSGNPPTDYVLDMRDAVECQEAVQTIASKMGSFSGLKSFAFCANGDDLMRVSANSNGQMQVTGRDLRDRQECIAAAQAINGSN